MGGARSTSSRRLRLSGAGADALPEAEKDREDDVDQAAKPDDQRGPGLERRRCLAESPPSPLRDRGEQEQHESDEQEDRRIADGVTSPRNGTARSPMGATGGRPVGTHDARWR